MAQKSTRLIKCDDESYLIIAENLSATYGVDIGMDTVIMILMLII